MLTKEVIQQPNIFAQMTVLHLEDGNNRTRVLPLDHYSLLQNASKLEIDANVVLRDSQFARYALVSMPRQKESNDLVSAVVGWDGSDGEEMVLIPLNGVEFDEVHRAQAVEAIDNFNRCVDFFGKKQSTDLDESYTALIQRMRNKGLSEEIKVPAVWGDWEEEPSLSKNLSEWTVAPSSPSSHVDLSDGERERLLGQMGVKGQEIEVPESDFYPVPEGVSFRVLKRAVIDGVGQVLNHFPERALPDAELRRLDKVYDNTWQLLKPEPGSFQALLTLYGKSDWLISEGFSAYDRFDRLSKSRQLKIVGELQAILAGVVLKNMEGGRERQALAARAFSLGMELDQQFGEMETPDPKPSELRAHSSFVDKMPIKVILGIGGVSILLAACGTTPSDYVPPSGVGATPQIHEVYVTPVAETETLPTPEQKPTVVARALVEAALIGSGGVGVITGVGEYENGGQISQEVRTSAVEGIESISEVNFIDGTARVEILGLVGESGKAALPLAEKAEQDEQGNTVWHVWAGFALSESGESLVPANDGEVDHWLQLGSVEGQDGTVFIGMLDNAGGVIPLYEFRTDGTVWFKSPFLEGGLVQLQNLRQFMEQESAGVKVLMALAPLTNTVLPQGIPAEAQMIKGESGWVITGSDGNVMYRLENGAWVGASPYTFRDGYVVTTVNGQEVVLNPDAPVDANGYTQTDKGVVVTRDGNAVALLNPDSNQLTITENGMLRVENQWFLYSKATNEWVLLPVEGSMNKDQVLVRQGRITIFTEHLGVQGLFVPAVVLDLESGKIFSIITSDNDFLVGHEYIYFDGNDIYLYLNRTRDWYKFPSEITSEEYFQASRNNLADWQSGKTVIDDKDQFQDNGPIPLRIYPKLWARQPTGGWTLHGVFLGMIPYRDKLAMLIGLEGQDGQRHYTAIQNFQDTWGALRFTLEIRPQNNLHPVSRALQRIHTQPESILRITSPFFNTPIQIEIAKLINRFEGYDVAPYCGEAELAAAVTMGQSVYAMSGPYVDMSLDELNDMTLACGGYMGVIHDTIANRLIIEQ